METRMTCYNPERFVPSGAFQAKRQTPQQNTQMKITQVETITFRNVTQVHAGGIGWTWVRIHTDTGLCVLGETFPAPDSEKAVILGDYAPVLLGRDPRDIERLW